MPLSKLDIDVLVQVAVMGPLESDRWRPLTDDPDGFGSDLQTLNVAALHEPDDAGPPYQYRFEPLPIAITAIEGLKQIAFFIYNSAVTDTDSRLAVRTSQQLAVLRSELESLLAGYGDAPWGWSAEDISQRGSRPSLAANEEPAPRVAHVFALWEQVGVQLEPIARGVVDRHLSDPRRWLGGGYASADDALGLSPMAMNVYADSATADLAFLIAVRNFKDPRYQHGRFARRAHFYRFGDVVAEYVWNDQAIDHVARFADAFDAMSSPDRLGAPDDHWWSGMPPDSAFHAEVFANQVRLDPDLVARSSSQYATVVRTPKERDLLLSRILDDDLKRRVADVSLRTHSLILFNGIAELDDINAATWHTEILDRVPIPAKGPLLEFHVGAMTERVFTLVITDHLPATPWEVAVERPGLRRTVAGGPMGE